MTEEKEDKCETCGATKVQMWVGGNNSPTRIEWVCPKCEGQYRIGKISD